MILTIANCKILQFGMISSYLYSVSFIRSSVNNRLLAINASPKLNFLIYNESFIICTAKNIYCVFLICNIYSILYTFIRLISRAIAISMKGTVNIYLISTSFATFIRKYCYKTSCNYKA